MIRLSERDRPVFIMTIGISGAGKALAIDTVIPTISGWTTVENVTTGDKIFDENGNVCNVVNCTNIMYDRPCYEVIFSNGEKIIADEQHQWLTKDFIAMMSERNFNAKEKIRISGRKTRKNDWRNQSDKRTFASVKTTLEIFKTLKTNSKEECNHRINVSKPIQMEDKILEIEPYVLGCWLGDGTSEGSGFTCADEQILNEIKKNGYVVTKYDTKYSYGIYDKEKMYGGFKNKLRNLDLLKNKHIPIQYLRSSYSQRLELLKGLMDTDGTIDKKGRCEFCNTNKELAYQTLELINSLGIRASIRKNDSYLYDKYCGKRYRISFSPKIQIFKLQRKSDRVILGNNLEYTKYIYITNVKKIKNVPVKCIEVDSDSHLYLIGKSFIPTHNSTWIKEQTSDPNTVVVNPDMIRKELTGDISDQTQNSKVWYLAKQRVLEGLNSGKTVILDATNVDSKSRRQFVSDLPSSVLKAKIFNVDPEEAKRRVKKALESGEDRSAVPDFVIDKQHQKFLASTPEKLQQEGFELI